MINLHNDLGRLPIIYPTATDRPPTPRLDIPSGTPGQAPVTPINQAAAKALGCVGCASTQSTVAGLALPMASRLAGVGVGNLQTWYDKIPLWAKIAAGAVVFTGIAYGTYRLVR